MGNDLVPTDPEIVISDGLLEISDVSKRQKYFRFFMNVMSSLPWVGGVLSYIASRSSEKEQEEINDLHKWWLEEHKEKLKELTFALDEIIKRLDQFQEAIKDRIESEEYLKIVRKAFRSWDNSETKEKRKYIINLLVNSAATKLCTDDIIRLFNDWIDLYHEIHFIVIRNINQNPGIARGEIWDSFNDARPREDSAEADLFKLLIRDLSTGGILRQVKDVNELGQFVRKRPAHRSTHPSSTLESAFEESKPYTLTELGRQFVHYTMNESITRIGQE